MSDNRLIAARYATALFDLAQDARQHDEVKEDLLMLRAALSESKALRTFMENPIITRANAEKAMDTLLSALHARPLSRRFFALLARQRRLGLAMEATRKYLAMLAEHRGELSVRVSSARALPEPQRKLIAAALAKATGRKIEIEVSQDPALIGGMQVHIGSRMLDTTVAGKLSRLRRMMTEAA